MPCLFWVLIVQHFLEGRAYLRLSSYSRKFDNTKTKNSFAVVVLTYFKAGAHYWIWYHSVSKYAKYSGKLTFPGKMLLFWKLLRTYKWMIPTEIGKAETDIKSSFSVEHLETSWGEFMSRQISPSISLY